MRRSAARVWISVALALGPLAMGPLALGAAGCSGGEAPSVPAEDVQADVRTLLEAMLDDPARLPLEEVDEAFRDERPVRAADLIEQGAKPATARQIELLRALQMTSAEGRRLRSRAVRAYDARLTALEAMRVVLSRGIGQEDDQLLEAMRADSRAQIAIVDLENELRARLPERDDGPPAETSRLLERGLPTADEPLAVQPEEPNEAAGDPIEPPTE